MWIYKFKCRAKWSNGSAISKHIFKKEINLHSEGALSSDLRKDCWKIPPRYKVKATCLGYLQVQTLVTSLGGEVVENWATAG